MNDTIKTTVIGTQVVLIMLVVRMPVIGTPVVRILVVRKQVVGTPVERMLVVRTQVV